MKYFGIKRRSTPRRTTNIIRSTLNDTADTFETVGTKILRSFEFGADLGAKMAVNYDDENVDDVDVLTSPNHDFFDIAEEFSQMVDPTSAPQPSPSPETQE